MPDDRKISSPQQTVKSLFFKITKADSKYLAYFRIRHMQVTIANRSIEGIKLQISKKEGISKDALFFVYLLHRSAIPLSLKGNWKIIGK